LKNPGPVILFAVLALLAGCSVAAAIDKMAPVDVQEASKKAIGDLRERRFGEVNAVLAARLHGEDNGAAFTKMADSFPGEPEKSFKPVGYYVNGGTGGTRYDITYELEFSQRWVLVQLSWIREAGQLRIVTFRASPMAQSIEAFNAFTLRGKRAPHYLVLILGIIACSLSLYALVKCIRTKNLRRKWLWIPFILLGWGTFFVGWPTGQWSVALLHFQILSFSVSSMPGQLTLGASVPVGAVVFLDRLKRRRKAEAALPTSDGSPAV
jgi:hypothetical protein